VTSAGIVTSCCIRVTQRDDEGRCVAWLQVVYPTLVFGVLMTSCASKRDEVATRAGSHESANDENHQSEEDGPATLEAFYSEYAELNCQHTTECYGVALAAYCDYNESWFEDYYGPKAAKLVCHREEAADCLAALRKSECGDLG